MIVSRKNLTELAISVTLNMGTNRLKGLFTVSVMLFATLNMGTAPISNVAISVTLTLNSTLIVNGS